MKVNKQREYFGVGSIQVTEEIIKEYGGMRVFLVTGKNSFQECGAKKAFEKLLSERIVYRFYEFSVNPGIESIRKGIKTFRNFSPDIVVAIGGGSVIDMAKAINILSFQKENSEYYIKGEKKIMKAGMPLIAIPTTSGSGSEATHFSVIYIDKVKYSLAHPSMLPIVAIIDPALTFQVCPKITATTGADTFCQAIESYWSIKSTEESKKYAKASLNLSIKYLKKTVQNPTEESRIRMSESAHLAGKAINISKTTASHALSYPFTSLFGIPHGHAVALTLSRLLIYNSEVLENDVNDPRGLYYVIQTINDIVTMLGAESLFKAVEIIDMLFRDIGLELDLQKMGIFTSHLDGLISIVSIERMENNPRKISVINAKKILKAIL